MLIDGGGTNKVIYRLAIYAEAAGVVWHNTLSLGCSNYIML